MAPRPILMTLDDLQQFFSLDREEAKDIAASLPARGCFLQTNNYLYSTEEVKNELKLRRGE